MSKNNNLWNSFLELETYFNSEVVPKLYFELEKFCSYNSLYKKVYEYYGGYDILLKSLEILKSKISEGNLINKEDTYSYLKNASINVIKNHSRLKEFKHEDSILLIDDINLSNVNIIDTPYLSGNYQTDFDKFLNDTSISMGKMYSYLKIGKYDKCQESAKNFQKKINNENNLLYKQLSNGFLSIFKADLYFDQGRLDLSSKHIEESIAIFKGYSDKLGYAFLGNSLNTKAMIEINKGNISGLEIFSQNLETISSIKNHKKDKSLRELQHKTETYAFMFRSNINYTKLDYIIQKWLSDDSSSEDLIHNLYVKAYLYIDNQHSTDAIYLLENINEYKLGKYEDSEINKMRYYTAYAEALLHDFRNTNVNDLQFALSLINKAKNINIVVNNKYFKAVHTLFEGYILKDNSVLIRGLNMLKYNQYVHYYDWYKKKYLNSK